MSKIAKDLQKDSQYLGKAKDLQVIHAHKLISGKGHGETLNNQKYDIEVYTWGCIIVSKMSKRVLVEYAGNIKGVELLADTQQ